MYDWLYSSSMRNKNIYIRPAHPTEKEFLEKLQMRASLGNPGDRELLLKHPEVVEISGLHIKEGLINVAMMDEHIVGFAGIIQIDNLRTELDYLFVEPSQWKKGIGRLLVDSCVELSKSLRAEILQVIGNPEAEGFYISCGFRILGKVKTQFGFGLLMEREID